MKKNIVEFEIDGAKHGFKFGTYAASVACETDGCNLSELFRRIGVAYKNDSGEMVNDQANLKSLLHFFYGAAVHYHESKKLSSDFSTVDVSDWLDELGEARVSEMFKHLLEQYQPKNLNSLAETGDQITA